MICKIWTSVKVSSDEGVEYLTKFCRKLKILNLCGCVKAATDCALQAIGDLGVMSLAYGCPDLRCLDLCGCVRIIERKANIACFEDEDCTDSFSCSGIM
ncbi:hypothetical protein V6Z11_D06G130900 [Gossypium hirsutum]